MGYTRGVLPAGITFFGRAWDEPTLIELAYSYEQWTRHRRPPASTPPLR
jgi:Asp-tRNA(Asn)/Glu-tRNA(Gln) amidotransferase A subunit family amidase